jgi:hypothetical protein
MRSCREVNVPHLSAGFVDHFAQGKSYWFQLRLQPLSYVTWQSREQMVSVYLGRSLPHSNIFFKLAPSKSFGKKESSWSHAPANILQANYTPTMCDTAQKEFPRFFKLGPLHLEQETCLSPGSSRKGRSRVVT